MYKCLSISVAVLLIASSSALALGGIGQGENFMAVLNNGVVLMNGSQSASSDNFLTIMNDQMACTPCMTHASQDQLGFFTQVGKATGTCAAIGILQDMVGSGVQMQLIGDGVGPKMQTQSSGLMASQLATRADGSGTGVANQFATIAQNQNAMNAAGPAMQGSVIVGAQNAQVTGAAGSTGMAGGSITATTTQVNEVF